MTTTELAPIPPPLLPMTVDEAQAGMAAYQELTARLLVADDWQGIPGRDQSFVKRRGWAKLATFYGVSTELRHVDIDRDSEGQPTRARCVARATHPNGRYAEGDGACSITERRFRDPGGRQKVEHDLPATAATRATNRAISNLIGFGAVSAEEVDGDTPTAPTPAAAPWGPVTDDSAKLDWTAQAIAQITGADLPRAAEFVVEMGKHFDGIPEAGITMLRGLVRFAGDTKAAAPESEATS